ncbi:hypothetical protein AGMMS49992_20880 [Clostridia bacterium]|nr:hypothetical protein AGMMS49992_20880 [Clostridia bacterium]
MSGKIRSDPIDFEQTYIMYHTYVYRYVFSMCRNPAVAEDVTAEAFLKALHHIENFKGECDIKVWLCQIAKNTYFSMRKREERVGSGDAALLEEDGSTDSAADRLDTLEIHRALHYLDEPYKEVFSLRMFGGLSYTDISGLFGKSESWARIVYHRAKLSIREALK